MTSNKTPAPNPGSDAAIEKGCTCPVLDNARGKGRPYGDGDYIGFWIDDDCPIHGQATGEE